MVEPNKEALADETVPRIKLAGKEWPVPELALEQNIQVFAPMVRRLATLNALRSGGALMSSMTPDALTDFATVVYWGLTRAHRTPDGKAPALTRAEFDAMPITVTEVMEAVTVVGRQSSMFKSVKASEVAPPLDPAATTSLPTG